MIAILVLIAAVAVCTFFIVTHLTLIYPPLLVLWVVVFFVALFASFAFRRRSPFAVNILRAIALGVASGVVWDVSRALATHPERRGQVLQISTHLVVPFASSRPAGAPLALLG